MSEIQKHDNVRHEQRDSIFKRASALHQVGDLTGADRLYRQVLSIDDAYIPALQMLAVIHEQMGNLAAVLEFIDKIILLRPDYAEAFFSRGIVQKNLSRFADAVDSYDSAIRLNPGYVEAFIDRGSTLRELGRHAEALDSYSEAIRLRPESAEAFFNRGNILQELGRFEEALASYETAIRLKPAHAEAHNNRGNTLAKMLRWEESLPSYDRAIALKPNYAEAFFNRGTILEKLGRLEPALESLNKAIGVRQDVAEVFYNRGVVLERLNLLEDALASYERSIAINPEFAEAFYNRGVVLQELRRMAESIASFERASSIKPHLDMLTGLLLFTRMRVCDWRGYDERMRDYLASVNKGDLTSPWCCLSLIGDPALHHEVARRFAETKYPASLIRGVRPPHQPGDRIRIGYYSADFYSHATMLLIAEMLKNHDRQRFEIFGFFFGPHANEAAQIRAATYFDQFIDVNSMSDMDVVALSRKLKVDIAVDLKGYTQYQRAGIFAARCAPIQVNYLGYPGSMGAQFIDYIIADKWVIPAQSRSYYTEKVVSLPQCYQPNGSRREVAARIFTRAELNLPERGFVFCCFNNNYKIHPDTFDCWMRILAAVDGSVMWLLADNPDVVENLQREARVRGINPVRLVFATRMSAAEHLSRHRAADLFLDTWPYGAHTTGSDSLWVGVPIITLAGRSFASRVGMSLLSSLGLEELVTESVAEYEALAVSLARDPVRLGMLKQRLLRARVSSPLFDGRRLVRELESAYMSMVDRLRLGLPPDVIEIQAHSVAD